MVPCGVLPTEVFLQLIQQYQDNKVNLKYAVRDAKNIEEKLKDQTATLYKPGIIHYTILGLGGKAGEKKVTVEGLITYVKNRLPNITEKYRGNPQYPVSWGTGMDFPLVVYE